MPLASRVVSDATVFTIRELEERASWSDRGFAMHPTEGKRNLGMDAGIKSLIRSFEERTVPERRWGKRRPSPRLAVYYWNGEAPAPHGIRNISSSGVYLFTQEPLFPGAMLLLTMQREDLDESSPDRWIAVHAVVIRRDLEGVALLFVFPRTHDSRLRAVDLANGATRDEMARFMSKLFEHDDSRAQETVRASDAPPAPPDPGSISASAEFSRTRRPIGRSKVSVYNLTRECLVSLDMSIVDTVHEPLKALVDDLSHVPGSGLWLTPFRGLPLGSGLSRFDVIFLDDNYRIVECAEQFAVAESGSFQGEHASALVVPSLTISLLQIQVGDQLRICSPESRATVPADPLCSIADSTPTVEELDRKQARCLRDAVPPLLKPASEGVGNVSRLADETRDDRFLDWNNPEMKTRFLRWLFPSIKPADQRRAQRIPAPELISFHHSGGEPKAYKVGDVSSTGLYLLTDERWLPGTRIVMTLQKDSCAGHDPADWSRVETEVVRSGVDGVGFEFVEMNHTKILQRDEFETTAFQQFLAGVTARQPNGPYMAHS